MTSLLAALLLAGLLTASGCSSAAPKEDSGTLAATYNVTVTAIDTVGTTPYSTGIVIFATVH